MDRLITWMHPSYRDLVIDELQNDPKLRLEFLHTTGIYGIKLALSDTGGSQGARNLPLMVDKAAWVTLRDRCIHFIDNSYSTYELHPLFDILSSSVARAKTTNNLANISFLINDVCANIIKKWKNEILDARQVEAYIKISIYTNPLTCLPDLLPTWNKKTEQLTEKLAYEDESLEDRPIQEWVSFLSLISKFEPRLLMQLNFPDNFQPLIGQLIRRISDETEWDFDYSSPDELQQDIDRFEEFSRVCETLYSVLPIEYQNNIRTASTKIQDKIDDLRENLPEEPEIVEMDYEPPDTSNDYFDIDALFADL